MYITYVGTSDIRRFTEDDAIGVELEFIRGVPQKVDGEVAEAILESPGHRLEFVGVEATSEPDGAIDDLQEAFPGL